ncbi:Inner spore coat protein H [Peribacillus sp. Bi96]|uniref:CotH kinase family protein n=1 Tax=unclassified Peribacillus TaxID=2675266 RepID=UPI001D50306D|nr:CotH kinase family protein [Peribacillus sp. Bi96]CAH0207730.1 Inner spore coat protein H [Peribacillus sp. Bi96]
MNADKKLPVYQLFIPPVNLKELRSDIWCNDPVPAKLTINKKKLDIDIVYRGSHIRSFRKKSYNVVFYKPNTFRNAKEIHLNGEYKDRSLLRNKLSLDFFADIGTLSPKSQFVFLNLNGKDEGIYLELESVDEYYLRKRDLPKGSIFYAVDGDANFSLMSDLDKGIKKSLEMGYQKKCGTAKDELYLQELIMQINTIPRVDFEREIVKYVDMEKYLRWLAGVILTQNYDGFVHNYALYRNGDTGLFEIIPWDYDATWGRDVNGKVMEEDYVGIEGFNTLTARILDIRTFRVRYQSLLKEILNTQFNVKYMKPIISEMHDQIRPYVSKDPYIKDKKDKFDNEPDFILKFIKARAKYVNSQLYKLD